MTDIVVAQRMWQRRDTAANWTAKNPVLAAGEIGIELPTTVGSPPRSKTGDGVTAWNAMGYDAEPAIAAGTSAQYWRGDKTWGDFFTDVRAATLAGLSTATNAVIAATDTVLVALGKLQAQVSSRIASTEKGAANGVAPLGSDGKINISYLPSSVLGQVSYQSTWDATSGAPTASPAKGQYWVVNVAGSTNLSGITDWKVGDWAIYDGTAWEKVDNTDALSSWNGRLGAVVPQAGDYTAAQVGAEPAVVAGTSAQYWRGDKTWQDLSAAVRSVALAGLSTATNAVVSAADTVLSAIGKLQAQVSDKDDLGAATAALAAAMAYVHDVVPANVLYVDAVNGRVGVGTTSPTFQFHVEGATAGLYLNRTGGSESFVVLVMDGVSKGQVRSLSTGGLKVTNADGTAEWVRFDGDLSVRGGRLYGTALHNNAAAMTGTVNQYVGSGTYTPTLFNSTNVAASTAYTCQWIRVGNVVHVTGKVQIDPTNASTLTVLGLSLPIPSAISASEQLGGTMSTADVASYSGACAGDATNDRAFLFFTNGTDVGNRTWYFTFSYLVL